MTDEQMMRQFRLTWALLLGAAFLVDGGRLVYGLWHYL